MRITTVTMHASVTHALLNKVDPLSWGRGVKMTDKLCEQTEPRSASMYSLGLSPFMSLDHLQSAHSALCVPRSWPTLHSRVAEFTALLYRLIRWRGRSIPHAGLGSARPCKYGMRTWIVTSPPVTGVLPNAACWTTAHAADSARASRRLAQI